MNPEHSILQFACRQDYESFYEYEIEARREAGYPPFSKLVRLLYRAPEESDAAASASTLAEALRKESNSGALILGPAPAPIEKLNNQYRYHILIKTENTAPVRQLLKGVLPNVKKKPNAHLEIDFDPIDLI